MDVASAMLGDENFEIICAKIPYAYIDLQKKLSVGCGRYKGFWNDFLDKYISNMGLRKVYEINCAYVHGEEYQRGVILYPYFQIIMVKYHKALDQVRVSLILR